MYLNNVTLNDFSYTMQHVLSYISSSSRTFATGNLNHRIIH